MKIKIEVNVPDSVDLEHAIESISDATFVADNVTQAEANLVFSILTKLQVEKDRVVDTNQRDFNQPYQTTSVSQIATQIKNMVEKIRQSILDGRGDLVLDWDSNEIEFDKGYLIPRVAPLVITYTHKFLFDTWENSSELLKQLYWKASKFDYVLVSVRSGELIIKLCHNIEDRTYARVVAFSNYQKSIYDCKKNKEVKL
jgi:hypothetical protein